MAVVLVVAVGAEGPETSHVLPRMVSVHDDVLNSDTYVTTRSKLFSTTTTMQCAIWGVPATPSRPHLTRTRNASQRALSADDKGAWDLLHPSAGASATQDASVEGSMYPLLASDPVAGLPITSLVESVAQWVLSITRADA